MYFICRCASFSLSLFVRQAIRVLTDERGLRLHMSDATHTHTTHTRYQTTHTKLETFCDAWRAGGKEGQFERKRIIKPSKRKEKEKDLDKPTVISLRYPFYNLLCLFPKVHLVSIRK